MQRLAQLSVQFNQTGASDDIFGHIEMAPVDPILGTTLAYRADPDPRKVDVGVGAYRTDDSQPYVFKVVRKCEKEIVDDLTVNKEYLPIDGLADFNRLAQELVFGKENPLVKDKKIITAQSISGTGSLRVGFEFIRTHLPADVYVPKPTWGNHLDIIQRSGLKHIEYPYYNPKTRGLDLQGMLNSLGNAKPGSVVLLHACAHNPTGVDPTEQEWEQIANLMKQKKLVPFIDLAYPAFASGDFNKDTEIVRKFAAMGFQMFVAQSFAKILGLYSERLGAIHLIASSKEIADKALSQMKRIMRAMYSNPPAHGARIFVKIFSSPVHRETWNAELKELGARMIKMRYMLRDELVKLGTPGNWDHIVKQNGMFSYTGLTPEQCEVMIKKHHIYMLKNGRVSIAAVTSHNAKYIAAAIDDSVRSSPAPA